MGIDRGWRGVGGGRGMGVVAGWEGEWEGGLGGGDWRGCTHNLGPRRAGTSHPANLPFPQKQGIASGIRTLTSDDLGHVWRLQASTAPPPQNTAPPKASQR